MEFTRASASVCSLFGPILAGLIVFIAPNNKALLVIFGLLFVTIRIYPALWYVGDKKRNPAWAALSIIGFWGWVVLWFVLKDYSQRINLVPVFITCERCNKTFYQEECLNGVCNDCISLSTNT